jgi:hypothetical protein
MWGALSDERTGLSFARVTVTNNVCFQYVQFTFYMLLNVYTRPLSFQARTVGVHAIRIKCYVFEGPMKSSGRFAP